MNRKWFDDPDYAEHLMFQREADAMQKEREMNTPVGKWAPADFLYDPLKDHEEKFSLPVTEVCPTCTGAGNVWHGPDELAPCPDCTNPGLYAEWDAARERHYENCAGAHGLPPGGPC